LVRIAIYRFALLIGVFRWLLPIGSSYDGPFWAVTPKGRVVPPPALRRSILARSSRIRAGVLAFFSFEDRDVGFPPEWLHDFRGPRSQNHWTQVSEFGGGDIKRVWEPSRFDVVPVLAAAIIVDPQEEPAPVRLDDLNDWFASWVRANPANAGPNWRCAQETALRLINTLIADRLLREQGARHAASLERFVKEHCARIRPTMMYAVAQDNNHATSEAVALYVGGGWLARFATGNAREYGRGCMQIGRRAFEHSTRRLVLPDGSFAQHSVNYHRLFLDTACVFELFRREFSDRALAVEVHHSLDLAARWLADFTDPVSGDAPNLGANDGARLLQLARSTYRDFRPHVQLAAALLSGVRAWPSVAPEATDDLLFWFGVPRPTEALAATGSRLFPEGGYALLVDNDLRVFVRLPVFRFRPSHSDILHLDVWWKGENITRDGGTYSYNTDPRWMAYFPGVASHNTVQFCGRDQMPRLSRFLFGRWPGPERLVFCAKENAVGCGYRDYRGARHWRRVAIEGSTVCVSDLVDTREAGATAVTRLRLRPGAWRIDHDGAITDGGCRVVFDNRGDGIALGAGFESRNYDQMDRVAVVERMTARFPEEVNWSIRFG